MIAIIMLDSIFFMGYNDFMLALQPLLTYLKASNTLIGLITGIRFVAVAGNIISPFITRRFRYKKWYMFVAHIPYLSTMGIMGLVIVNSHRLGMSNASLLQAILALTVVQWFFAGFVDLPHQEFVTACIPMSHRGRYTGWSFTVGGALSMIAAAICGLILLRYSKPMAFGYVIIMSWAFTQTGYLAALAGRERPSPVEKSPSPWSLRMLNAFWDDKRYVRFLSIWAAAYILVGGGSTFIAIYGFKELKMAAATSAAMMMIAQCIKIPTSFLAGMLTDKLGPKTTYTFSFLLAAISFLPAILLHSALGVYLSVALSALFGTVQLPSALALLYGIPKPENRAGHFTMQLLCGWTSQAIGPIMIGALCDLLSFKIVFACISLIGFALFPISRRVLSNLSDDVGAYS